MKKQETIYKATIINNPNGKNNPILKFKLENGSYIEKEYNSGAINWGKGQTIYIIYDNNEIKVIDKYKFPNLYKIPLLLYPLISIFIIIYIIANYECLKLYMIGVFAGICLIPIVISGMIYYVREKKNREKNNQKTYGKIIAFVPVFKNHFQKYSDYTYYAMEWRVLFEFKTYNGNIFRKIENDRNFEGDRDPLTHIYNLNSNIPVIYNEENPLNAFIDYNEYKLEFKSFKGGTCKAKIIQIETVEIESLEKENLEIKDCFKQDYLICEYEVNNQIYKERTMFPVNCGMFSIGDEVEIQYNVNNCMEYNVIYIN